MHLRLLYKKFLCVFMSLMIVIFSTQSVYANTSVGGWTALDTITAGANNTINATKTAAGKALKSAITIAPQAGKVGKYLLRGGAVGALALAVPQILGDGVDWVLDPANNSVKYKPVAGSDGTVDAFGTYTVVGGAGGNPSASTAQAACSAYVVAANAKNASITGGLDTHKNPVATASVCTFDYSGKPHEGSNFSPYSYPISFKPSAESGIDEDGYKHIPISTVAAKVISNAEAGDPSSQEAVKAVALEGFAAGEHDAALEVAAVPAVGVENPPDTGVENPPDTTNPENPPAPAEPFDPSSIIAAINSLKAVVAGMLSSMTGFFDWWQAQWATFSTGITEFFEWVRAEPDTASLQPEPVEVSEGTLVDGWQDKANAGYVNMGNTQCPSDVLIPISYMGASTNLSLSYVPFCHFASIIRYAVILGAWVAALMIISGGRTKE